jgi:hypothetical protein
MQLAHQIRRQRAWTAGGSVSSRPQPSVLTPILMQRPHHGPARPELNVNRMYSHLPGGRIG